MLILILFQLWSCFQPALLSFFNSPPHPTAGVEGGEWLYVHGTWLPAGLKPWQLSWETSPSWVTACAFTYWQLKAKWQKYFEKPSKLYRKSNCSLPSNSTSNLIECLLGYYQKDCPNYQILVRGKFWRLVLFWFGMKPVISKLPTKKKFIGKK